MVESVTFENSMKSHKIYLAIIDKRSISYSAHVIAIFKILPCTPQLRYWLWPLKFAIRFFEGTLASEVGTPGLSKFPISISRIE
jgi:hypothetical protein